jgi:hypothetical protein
MFIMLLLYAVSAIAIYELQNLFRRRAYCPRCKHKVVLDEKNKKCTECNLRYVEQFVSGRNDIEKMTWDHFLTAAQLAYMLEQEEIMRQERELQTQIWLKKDHNWSKEGF